MYASLHLSSLFLIPGFFAGPIELGPLLGLRFLHFLILHFVLSSFHLFFLVSHLPSPFFLLLSLTFPSLDGIQDMIAQNMAPWHTEWAEGVWESGRRKTISLTLPLPFSPEADHRTRMWKVPACSWGKGSPISKMEGYQSETKGMGLADFSQCTTLGSCYLTYHISPCLSTLHQI